MVPGAPHLVVLVPMVLLLVSLVLVLVLEVVVVVVLVLVLVCWCWRLWGANAGVLVVGSALMFGHFCSVCSV